MLSTCRWNLDIKRTGALQGDHVLTSSIIVTYVVRNHQSYTCFVCNMLHIRSFKSNDIDSHKTVLSIPGPNSSRKNLSFFAFSIVFRLFLTVEQDFLVPGATL